MSPTNGDDERVRGGPAADGPSLAFDSPSPYAESGRSLWARAIVVFVAVAAALLHLAPYWLAERSTPDGWEFTGNLHSSPDFMQYRLWIRQTMDEGAIVTNRFTSEPHRAFLPVIFYQLVGAVARAGDLDPEWTHVYVGVVLAAILVWLFDATARRFVADGRHRWWIVGALLAGGGLGAHLKYARTVVETWLGDAESAVSDLGPLVGQDRVTWLLVEDYRGHYVYSTLFDTHYLMVWVVMLIAVLAFQRALLAPAPGASAAAAISFAAATALHLYAGPTLVAIAVASVSMWWVKKLPVRRAIVDAALCAGAAVAVLALFLFLQLRSGLPMPTWRGLPIPLAILIAAHPVAWALLLWGFASHWRTATAKDLLLIGWVLGCTLVTLSSPFYPYADRGAMTLQIPLYLIAGSLYFRRFSRVSLRAFAVLVLLMGASPAWISQALWKMSRFSPDAPQKWLDREAQATVAALRLSARTEDVLLSEPSQARWLAPEYPGRHYVAHFFLTVDYERKKEEHARFCLGDDLDRGDFLETRGIRFVHLLNDCAPLEPAERARLRLLSRDGAGALYEVRRDGAG